MNLEEKKSEFANRPKISPEFQAVTALFDQGAVQKDIAALQMQTSQVQNIAETEMKTGDAIFGLGIHLLFGNPLRQEIAEKRAEAFDAHYDCTAEYYRSVIEDMGFERVGEYPLLKDDGRIEKSFIHVRPDGLFLTWDTFSMCQNAPIVNSANIHFQWIGFDDDERPFGASGGFQESPYDTWIYVGSCDVREGVREKINKLLSNGSFCSPFPVNDKYIQSSALLSSQDWSDLRKKIGLQKLVTSQSFEMTNMVEERYNNLPLWAQQMIRPMKFEDYYHQLKPKTP